MLSHGLFMEEIPTAMECARGGLIKNYSDQLVHIQGIHTTRFSCIGPVYIYDPT